jgi:hypothetical protein
MFWETLAGCPVNHRTDRLFAERRDGSVWERKQPIGNVLRS